MIDRSNVIFGNQISKKTYKKAIKSKKKYIKKFGDDTNTQYHLGFEKNAVLGDSMGICDLKFQEESQALDPNAVIIGNIRMGFGHYRISIAMASCAHALGYTPYWLDLNSFDCTGSKMIQSQNDLYSLGSRISQKSHLFNALVWEPVNSEGFRKLDYNAIDQKNSELLAPILNDLDVNTPYIATHVWPSQAAVHHGMKNVVNAIPDNWPMALHLSEGAIHTVQTPFAYLGYKELNGMAKSFLKPMPENTLYQVGHYIDHELVSNLEEDTKKRLDRVQNKKPLRFILTVGGAGAQGKMFQGIIEYLLPYIKENKVQLFVNYGDHFDFYEEIYKKIPECQEYSEFYIDQYADFTKKVESDSFDKGLVAICNHDIFQAVYSTNLLMRISDLIITKPSELAYYPIPKLMIHRVGGHEAYGAIHTSEYGDGTYEIDDLKHICHMIDLMLQDPEILVSMNHEILKLKDLGVYNGAYEVVRLATQNLKK